MKTFFLFTFSLFFLSSGILLAQPAEIPYHVESYKLESGFYWILGKNIKDKEGEYRGIGKLKQFLVENVMPDQEKHIEFLKDLYALRSSGVGHRKGKRYEKISLRFEIDKKPLKEVFVGILEKAEKLLVDLEAHFS